MVLRVHSFFSLWCWWVSSPHTSELSLEVLDVNFCSGICWVQRKGSVPAVERGLPALLYAWFLYSAGAKSWSTSGVFKSFIYFFGTTGEFWYVKLKNLFRSHFFGDLLYRVANMALSAPMISVDLLFFSWLPLLHTLKSSQKLHVSGSPCLSIRGGLKPPSGRSNRGAAICCSGLLSMCSAHLWIVALVPGHLCFPVAPHSRHFAIL